MDRRDMLRVAGLAGLASLIPIFKTKASNAAIDQIKKKAMLPNGSCILIPQETEGPYPFDLSNDQSMFRQDITEGNTGTPLNLTLTLVNINDNCNPISNARVDIWHCNKDGYYSAFANQPGYLGTQNHVGETFFRGIQLTDSNGQVNFTTIYPGWYSGRVTHIHFQVFLSSLLSATSQMAFPDSLNTEVYNTSPYDAHGQNPTTNANDNVFSDTGNTQYEMLDISADGNGGYNASLVVGISAPTTGLIELEPETGGQFKKLLNYPNPFNGSTTIQFVLTNPSKVIIDLYDMQGKKLAEIVNRKMDAGQQQVLLSRNLGDTVLTKGNYAYQLKVENENGNFFQSKLLTVD